MTAEMEFKGMTPADLADGTATAAEETANTIQDILTKVKGGDAVMEKLQSDLNDFADACHFLHGQLLRASGLDDIPEKAEDAQSLEEKFRFSVVSVLQLWLTNMRKNSTHLRRHQKYAMGWVGKLANLNYATSMLKEINLSAVLGTAESHMGDVQMFIAYFNLRSELDKAARGDGHSGLEFLCKDIEWKAAGVQSRVTRARKESNLPQKWGRTHEIIADASVALAAEAKKSAQVAPSW
ncbi:uncharacterized protein LTR77_004178 [Saxophila tyrrhenica]|uniref:Uncharacterized protein n=1 Tax=Saxophila tyrrhenica TaxID=1690608 RepID=A0AAV9PBX6_9PEZI|nr:hypothetical protein LTR77_004178 [Saxophila tyrrhenica]